MKVKEFNVYLSGQEYVVITTKANSLDDAIIKAKKIIETSSVKIFTKPYIVDKVREKWGA